jgi:selT/selW/selH-like putative selenoprotein
LAAALEERFGTGSDLIEGEHGVFEVAVDGKTVFSKSETGSFISTPAMVERVAAHLEVHGTG